MKLIRAFLLLCCVTLVVQIVQPPVILAKLYTWKDRNGGVRRTYYPPPSDQVWKGESGTRNPSTRQSLRDQMVELYVTNWCPYCKQAIQYFQSKGIAARIYDIEKDKKAAARKKKLDGRSGVPFAVVNGTRIHGYSPERYSAALKK